MDEVLAWVEDQRDFNREIFEQLLEKGRRIWTPKHIFNRCCVKWLIDGPRNDEYRRFDEYSPRDGCTLCNRDHPRITLGFDTDRNSTTATLSHRLDPFLSYFDWHVAKGTAQCSSNTVYHLDGYLRHNLTAIRSYDGFGGHLIMVEQGAMDASDAAQTAVMEESERAKKRPCVKYYDLIDRSKSFDMLNEVMDIAMDARLKSDLINDPLSLYCMRSVNKYFKKLAESIASEKIKTLNLSITPLIDGKEIYGEDKIYCYDSETCHVGDWDLEVGPSDFFVMKRGKSWDSGNLRDVDEPYFEEDKEDANHSTYAYRGQLIRVYWHPSNEDPIEPPMSTEKPSLGILSKSNVAEIVEEKEESNRDNDDYNRSSGSEQRSPSDSYIRYSGKIKITKLKVNYKLLVEKHAQRVEAEIRRKHMNIQKERPLTPREKDYEALVKAASR